MADEQKPAEKTEPKPQRSLSKEFWDELKAAGSVDRTSENPGAVSVQIGTGKPSRTPEEQSCIDAVARVEGKDWAESHASLILDQARSIGDL